MEINTLLKNPKCLVAVSHSGGKDSQAMAIMLIKLWKSKGYDLNRLHFIHADLGSVEWNGVQRHIKETLGEQNIHICKARRTFFQMVRERGMFPSKNCRQCTSDLKRGPIQKVIRHICKNNGFEFVLDCMGIRSEESTARKKKSPFTFKPKLSCNKRVKRTWYQWFPIFDWTEGEVKDYIHSNNEKLHPVYYAGMGRLSCVFCIMSSDKAVYVASKLNPEKYREFSELEREVDNSLLMPKNGKRRFLPDVVKEYEEKIIKEGNFNAVTDSIKPYFLIRSDESI